MNPRKITTIILGAPTVLLLASCGGDSDPATLSSPSDAEQWINNAGYTCSDWQENSDSHAVCRTDGGGSFTISIDEDPESALDWYFAEDEWANGAAGENWFSPCTVSEMDRCSDLASAAGVDLISNPRYAG